jgi:hypothetical protein
MRFRINRLLEFEIVQTVLVGTLLLSLGFFLGVGSSDSSQDPMWDLEP